MMDPKPWNVPELDPDAGEEKKKRRRRRKKRFDRSKFPKAEKAASDKEKADK